MKRPCYLIFSLIIWIGLLSGCINQPRMLETPTVVTPVGSIATHTAIIMVATETLAPTETQIPDFVREIMGQVHKGRIVTDLKRLTGIEPICTSKGCRTITGRETGSEGLQWAKDYIYEELVNLGYDVVIQDWSSGDYADQNLIVRKQGTDYPDEEIYFIAHLDGYQENNPAADDDASGVVSILELARVLSVQSVKRSVVIAFFTGEEHGALGSRSYVDQLSADQIDAIKYVVNVDTIGYDSDNDGAMQLWSGDQPTDFVETLSEVIETYQLDLKPEIVTGCD